MFGPPSKPEKQDSILQQTPSFYDSRFQLKAKNLHAPPDVDSEEAKLGKDAIASKLSPMNLLSSAQILKPQKQCSRASHYNQITPGQFLRQAAPLGGSNLISVSPKDVRLFANMRRQTPIQTPTQPVAFAQAGGHLPLSSFTNHRVFN